MTRNRPVLKATAGSDISRSDPTAPQLRPHTWENGLSNLSIHDEESAIVQPDVEESDTFAIYAELLIPGIGDPISPATVVIQGGKIAYVGKQWYLPPKYGQLQSSRVRVLMPGLWDCHCHLIGAASFRFNEVFMESQALRGARIARSLHDILMSGYTSVRDLGSHACEVSKAVTEGTIVGPNVYSAGACISQTAGHGDLFGLPLGWVWNRAGVNKHANGDDVGEGPFCIADGVDDCRRAVRLQLRRGAKVIKVFASGGVLSRDDNPSEQQFSDEELKVMVEEAGRHNRVVAAHVHGKAGILAAIRAGCKTLEHGTYLDDECVKLMKEKDIMLVATRTIVLESMKHPELMDPASYKKLVETDKYHQQAYSLAIKAGIKIALGTDLGISVPGSSLSLGKGGGEPSHAVEAGMSPLEAIQAATANGPLTLGPQAPKSGQIKVGYDADLIGLTKNPLNDIGVFKDVANITHVWKGGKLFKSPSIRYSFAP